MRPPLGRLRTLLFAAITTIAFFGVLEGSLRTAGAAVAWRHRVRAGAALSSAASVELWAFGDSYTFGVGANDPATEGWPAAAGALLTERLGVPVRVRNFGQPGLNSTEIADRVIEAAASGKPWAIAMLAGVNNARWLGQSGQFCLEEQEGSFVDSGVRAALAGTRTWKLLAFLALRVRPPRAPDRACRAVAEGFQHLDEGYPDRAEAAFRVAIDVQPHSAWGRAGLGIAMARMGRHEAAVESLSAAEGRAGGRALHLALAWSLRAAGRLDEASARASAAAPSDLEPFAALLRGWVMLDRGDAAAAVEAADRVLAPSIGEPNGGVLPWAHDLRGWGLLAMQDDAAAEAAFSDANEIGAEVHATPHLLGTPSLGLAELARRRGDPDAALRYLDDAARDSASVATAEALRAVVEAQRGGCASAALADAVERAFAVVVGHPLARAAQASCADPSALAALRPSPQPTISVQQWLDPGDTRLLRRDIERAAAAAAAVPSRFVVLTYPQPNAHPELAEAARSAAASVGADFVDPRPAFRRALAAGAPWEHLLIPDGHPTSAGYRLVADEVASALAP